MAVLDFLVWLACMGRPAGGHQSRVNDLADDNDRVRAGDGTLLHDCIYRSLVVVAGCHHPSLARLPAGTPQDSMDLHLELAQQADTRPWGSRSISARGIGPAPRPLPLRGVRTHELVEAAEFSGVACAKQRRPPITHVHAAALAHLLVVSLPRPSTCMLMSSCYAGRLVAPCIVTLMLIRDTVLASDDCS